MCVSRSVVSNSFVIPWTVVHQVALCPWNSPGKSTGMGCHSLLQGIFPIQGLNPGLPQCRRVLYQLSHKRSPIMDWVTYPFSRRSSALRNQTRVSCIAGEFFTNRAIREAPHCNIILPLTGLWLKGISIQLLVIFNQPIPMIHNLTSYVSKQKIWDVRLAMYY